MLDRGTVIAVATRQAQAIKNEVDEARQEGEPGSETYAWGLLVGGAYLLSVLYAHATDNGMGTGDALEVFRLDDHMTEDERRTLVEQVFAR